MEFPKYVILLSGMEIICTKKATSIYRVTGQLKETPHTHTQQTGDKRMMRVWFNARW